MRMLEVQQRYGCYRSARMQAAVDAGQAAELMRELPLALYSSLLAFHETNLLTRHAVQHPWRVSTS